MYKLIKPLIIAALFAGTAAAQEVANVKTGPDNEQSTKILKVLGENQYGIFYMAAKGDDLYVQRYGSKDMKIQESAKIVIPKKEGVTLELEEMFLMDNQILLFATGYASAKESYITYSFVIDKNCAVISDGKLVFTMPVEKKRRSGKVEYDHSADKKHILIYNNARIKAEELVRYSFILLDKEGAKVTEQSFDVPEGEGREVVIIENFTLDQNNDIHAVVSRSLYDRKTKEKNQNFEVLSYRSRNSYEPMNTKLTLGANNIISSVIIAARADGDLAVGGFYIPMKNGKRATGIEGTFFSTIDKAGNSGEVKIKPFSDEFKGNFMRDKKVEKGVDIPLTYIMREAYISDNDEITFVAEDYIFTEGENGAGDTYSYGYIVAIKVSADGDIIWEQLINKRQVYQEMKVGLSMITGGAGAVIGVSAWVKVTSDKNIYLSYKSWNNNGDLVFLFNDDSGNKDKLPGDKRDIMMRSLKSIPFSAKITSDGTLSYHYEEQLGDEETALRPRMSHVQEGRLYFVTAKRSLEKVGVADLN